MKITQFDLYSSQFQFNVGAQYQKSVNEAATDDFSENQKVDLKIPNFETKFRDYVEKSQIINNFQQDNLTNESKFKKQEDAIREEKGDDSIAFSQSIQISKSPQNQFQFSNFQNDSKFSMFDKQNDNSIRKCFDQRKQIILEQKGYNLRKSRSYFQKELDNLNITKSIEEKDNRKTMQKKAR
ncbi:hypothetical protein ABPG73_018946 [Tetrahymena malaccensis]